MEKHPLIKNKLTYPIISLSIGKDDLFKPFHILQERSHAAGDIEVANFQQLDQTDQVYEENKRTLKDGFELKIVMLQSELDIS